MPDFDSSQADFNVVAVSKEELPQIQEQVKSGGKAEAVLDIVYENGEDGDVRLKLYRPADKELVDGAYMDSLAYTCRVLLRESLLMSIGVEAENVGLAETAFSSDISVYGEELSEIREILNIVVPMLFAAIMFMFIVSYAQIIAQSVAMEKTSRVIELLITSVRPLAIVMGKVFAMLLVVLTQLAVIGAVVGGAVGILTLIAAGAGGGELLGTGIEAAQGITEAMQAADTSWQAELMQAVPGLANPFSVVMIVIIFLLGFLFYALLAALIGAGISRSEDLATGMQPLALISMVGLDRKSVV